MLDNFEQVADAAPLIAELLCARGFAVNLWDGAIDRVKAFRFD